MTMDSLRKPVPAAAPKALRGVANSLDAGKSVSVDVSGAHDKAGFMLCLADMDWESGVTTLIRITHAARLKATEPSVLTTFAEIIRDLAERSRIPVQVSVIA
jgi:hypothetical protein